MKKTICVILTLCIILSLAGCVGSGANGSENNTENTSVTIDTPEEAAVEHDFRNVTWGMSRDEVKKSESNDVSIEDESSMLYTSIYVANMDANLMYRFSEDKCVGSMYLFIETHTSENLYIDDYNRLVKNLTEKYGTPQSDDQKWTDDLYKDDPDDWGFAVSLGDLTYIAQWTTDNTDIYLILSGDNFKISLSLLYYSKDYDKSSSSSIDNL